MSLAGQAPKLTTPIKALYGLGALGTASKAQLFGLVLLFYNQLVGVDPALVGLALSVALLIDALWDPIVGQISDNTRSRLGRRHPYIYGAAIPAAICFGLLFMPPLSWSDEALFFYLLVFVVAGRMLDSVYEIPGSALMPELTSNYEERTGLQSWRYALGTVAGGAVAAFLGYGYFLRGTKAEPFGQLNMAGYAPYAITVAVISAATVLISARATQPFIPYLHQPVRKRATLGAIGRQIGLALANRNFVSLATSAFIFGISVGISGGLQSYFYTYFWELPSRDLLLLRLSAIPAGLLGVIMAPYGARLWGKKNACIGVFFLAIFSTTVPLGGRTAGLHAAERLVAAPRHPGRRHHDHQRAGSHGFHHRDLDARRRGGGGAGADRPALGGTVVRGGVAAAQTLHQLHRRRSRRPDRLCALSQVRQARSHRSCDPDPPGADLPADHHGADALLHQRDPVLPHRQDAARAEPGTHRRFGRRGRNRRSGDGNHQRPVA